MSYKSSVKSDMMVSHYHYGILMYGVPYYLSMDPTGYEYIK